jgi:triacylglycerol esterase/lipase EstA (alpha/beta hydrolase family)
MIAMPMQIGKTLDQLQGKSTADGSLRYVKGSVAGIPISINTYASMLSALGVGEQHGAGASLNKLDDYIDDRRHEANAFEFGYDWRRSIDENAVRLAEYVRQVTRFVQLQRGNHQPVKFDIVAHSMGGLIARYYLQYGGQLLPAGDAMPIANWAGSAQVERVVLIGPPNGGALPGLDCLLTGVPRNPITPSYDAVILATLPAIYQLFPRLRHKTFKV